jgi:hypothetical protein
VTPLPIMDAMNAASSDRVGVLVIRIWTEAGSRPRARITASLDITAGAPTVTIATASPDEACRIVRRLLLEFFDPRPTRS